MTVENLTIEVEANTDKARRSFEALTAVSQQFGRQMTMALSDAVVRGEDLNGVFRSLALSVASSSLQSGLQPLQQSISGGVNNVFSSFAGIRSGSSRSPATPFARGGVVATRSFFPLNQGFGLAGEAGPEAIMPLQRGNDGRLGVSVPSQASPPPVTINITTPDVAGFRRSEAQVSNALARAVQRSRRSG